jgi:DNA-binding MarR family transcriptional regulator
LREVFVALNDRALARLAERGRGAVRPVHGAVFQYLDDTGTTVSMLAERAQVTKQAMAELVGHLEANGYAVREPDPADRRAKLGRPTERGRDVITIVQALVPEVDAHIADILGSRRSQEFRADLETLRARLTADHEAASEFGWGGS